MGGFKDLMRQYGESTWPGWEESHHRGKVWRFSRKDKETWGTRKGGVSKMPIVNNILRLKKLLLWRFAQKTMVK